MPRSASLILALLIAVASPARSQHAEADHRRHAAAQPAPVKFPARLRDETLANMRDHLLALAEIQDRLAAGRFEEAADIAERRLGMSSLRDHGAHEVAKYMPAGMRAAGGAMHRAASRFALAAQEAAFDRDTGRALAALATVTQACVACHAAYRLR